MQEECILEEEYEFGVLCGGRRYKRQRTRDEKGELRRDPEGREPCVLVQTMEISYIGGGEEEF